MTTRNDVFTRDFIVKRVETRVAEIREQVKAAGAEIERFRKKQAKGDRVWLAAMRGSMSDLIKRIDGAATLEGNELVAEAEKIDSAIRRLYHSPSRDGLTYDEQATVRSLNAENQRLSNELAALEQVLIYLSDHPVQEWSITALQKIGILQVVKFRLSEQK